jgi:hypothetical protein
MDCAELDTCPTNAKTLVQVNAVGVSIEVLLNGTVTQYMDLPASRTTGPAVLYISSPWSPPANALVSNVKLVSILNFMDPTSELVTETVLDDEITFCD